MSVVLKRKKKNPLISIKSLRKCTGVTHLKVKTPKDNIFKNKQVTIAKKLTD